MLQTFTSFVRTGTTLVIFSCCILLHAAAFPAVCFAEELLLYDDFNSGSLDMSKWDVADWVQDSKTAFGDTPVMQSEGTTNFARFRVQTYNDKTYSGVSYKGTRVLGTDVYSDSLFARETGLICEARIRVTSAATKGLVASFFLYETYSGLSDEIDYEFLTNQSTNQTLLTNWNSWKSSYGYNDGVHHASSNPTVSGLNFASWTTVKILWLPSETRWIINGTEVWSTSQALPDQSMKLHINFWAPDSTWSTAYDSGVAPSSSGNTTYYYDVDYVTVSRYDGSGTPALPPLWLLGMGLLLGLLALAALGGKSAHR